MSFQYKSEIPQPIVPRSAAIGYAEREFIDSSVFLKTLDHYTDNLLNPFFLYYVCNLSIHSKNALRNSVTFSLVCSSTSSPFALNLSATNGTIISGLLS